jgi:hypothetical protein
MTTLTFNRADILNIINRVDESRKINNTYNIDDIINSLTQEEQREDTDINMDKKETKKDEIKNNDTTIEKNEIKNNDTIIEKNEIKNNDTIIEKNETKKMTKLAEKEEVKKAKLAEKEEVKKAKLAEKEESKKAKLAEKEEAKKAKLAEKEEAKKAKLAEKEETKKAKLAEKEASKKSDKGTAKKSEKLAGKRGRPKKEHVVVASGDYVESVAAQQIDLVEQLDKDSKSDDGDEEEIQATLFEFNGVVYYKSNDHVLYDKDSQDEVGFWDPVENEIKLNK